MASLELEFEKFLGKGSFGSVSLFKYSTPHTKLYTAVKTSDYNHAANLYEEFQILSQFKGCPRIVQCCENRVIEQHDGEGGVDYMMLLEYASGGSLKSFMKRFKDKKLPDSMVRDFTRMILEGLATVHGRGYVHCDLKPDNILVFPRCVCKKGEWVTTYELKISDFGLSKKDGDSNWWEPDQPFVGTPIYMSPESVSHGETGKGLDLWSLGCVVLEMYTGKRPWWHKDYDLEDLVNCYEPLVPNEIPSDAKHFIMTCFALEIEDRKDALTLSRHSFLRRDEQPLVKDKNLEALVKLAQRLTQRSNESKKIIKEQPRTQRPSLVPV